VRGSLPAAGALTVVVLMAAATTPYLLIAFGGVGGIPLEPPFFAYSRYSAGC
jgi:hypothetical protein